MWQNRPGEPRDGFSRSGKTAPGEPRDGYVGKTDETVDQQYDSTEDAYYFNLNKIANRRCLTGGLHDFQGKQNDAQTTNYECSICGRKKNIKYTKEELDILVNNMHKIDDQYTSEQIEKKANVIKKYHLIRQNNNQLMNQYLAHFLKTQ